VWRRLGEAFLDRTAAMARFNTRQAV